MIQHTEMSSGPTIEPCGTPRNKGAQTDCVSKC